MLAARQGEHRASHFTSDLILDRNNGVVVHTLGFRDCCASPVHLCEHVHALVREGQGAARALHPRMTRYTTDKHSNILSIHVHTALSRMMIWIVQICGGGFRV
jgi:hypothetical protein